MTLVKELELLRDGLNSRRQMRTGWGPDVRTDLGNTDLTEGLFNLIGTLITAYSDEDEMHAVQDDTPDVERDNDMRIEAREDLAAYDNRENLTYGFYEKRLLEKYAFSSFDRLREWANSTGAPFDGGEDDTPDVERVTPYDEPFKAGTPRSLSFDTAPITVAALAELARAKTKFPEWPKDPIHAYAVVQEEVGEGIRSALHAMYEYGDQGRPVALAELRTECIQSIAMLYRFVLSLYDYDWTPSEQFED